jgi:hypothetical protein
MFATLFANLTDIQWGRVARRDGVGALWPTARETVRRSFQEWRRERDLETIADTLHELSDRQLKLIGMQRATIDRDVLELSEWVEDHADMAATYGGIWAERNRPPKLLTYFREQPTREEAV